MISASQVVHMKTRRTIGFLTLAALAAVSVNTSAQRGQQRRESAAIRMSGTYELETTRGDDAQRAADQATRYLPPSQRDRAYQSLLGRLQPPVRVAIDAVGRTVTISSSDGPRATFDADGRSRDELGPGGRRIVVRAEFIGNRLSVSTSGNRSTDFLVTFEPLDNGNALLVTRRLDSDDLRNPVSIQSYYRRVSNDPRWDLYAPDRDYGPPPPPRAFMVPEGTRIMAVLDTELDTRRLRGGERFSMTVRNPMEFEGARIEGVIARITPYDRGHNADMRLDFDMMRLRNGQSAEFAGILDTVRTPGGVTLRVDASGATPDPKGTGDTVQQGAVGAALGAIIGAIAGGGKGAAIGAVVGGASGAILAQDRETFLDLPPGTQVSIIVRAPRR
jgi:hypothetical protein